MGASVERIERAVEAARGYLGARFVHKGRGPYAVDCAGLIIIALEAGGFSVSQMDCVDYEINRAWAYGLEDAVNEIAEPISTDEVRAGDLVMIRWPRTPSASHIALVTNYPYGGLGLIHAYSRGGVTEHSLTGKWLRRITQAYRPRWKEVD